MSAERGERDVSLLIDIILFINIIHGANISNIALIAMAIFYVGDVLLYVAHCIKQKQR